MSVFEVDRNSFEDSRDFHTYLSQNYSRLSGGDLYIIAGITELPKTDFIENIQRNGWEIIEELGDVLKLKNEYSENSTAESYLTFDRQEQLFFLYTDQRKTEEIKHGIEPLLANTPGLHYLYISPRILREIREQIAEDYEAARVTRFIAKRTSGTDIHANKRAGTRRTINYYGSDGLQTIREVEREYGVLPHIMTISIPSELTFSIDKSGIFKLQSGSLLTLFEYLEECIESCLEIKDAYDHTDYSTIEMASGVEISKSKPAVVELQTPLEHPDLIELKNNLRKEEYLIYDVYTDRETISMSGKVYDEDYNMFFNIQVDETQIRIFPEEESDISSFIGFLEFIHVNVDERAEPVAVTN
ncbi:hypothetical protein [Haloarcula amylolytica]|uniref:Uncharacterized protein n=1 Tax=Haloarcula amylolytica JCM 13557 TaxID=1227452 RepID=M0KVH8_9EURY|nr:hypothetical protein [Haloarcula amylolytica]EMA25307.1 hypothetical protein C442_02576 [Haloarcula amylolytica JCM 13557]